MDCSREHPGHADYPNVIGDGAGWSFIRLTGLSGGTAGSNKRHCSRILLRRRSHHREPASCKYLQLFVAVLEHPTTARKSFDKGSGLSVARKAQEGILLETRIQDKSMSTCVSLVDHAKVPMSILRNGSFLRVTCLQLQREPAKRPAYAKTIYSACPVRLSACRAHFHLNLELGAPTICTLFSKATGMTRMRLLLVDAVPIVFHKLSAILLVFLARVVKAASLKTYYGLFQSRDHGTSCHERAVQLLGVSTKDSIGILSGFLD